jgi:hypothetical protein
MGKAECRAPKHKSTMPHYFIGTSFGIGPFQGVIIARPDSVVSVIVIPLTTFTLGSCAGVRDSASVFAENLDTLPMRFPPFLLAIWNHTSPQISTVVLLRQAHKPSFRVVLEDNHSSICEDRVILEIPICVFVARLSPRRHFAVFESIGDSQLLTFLVLLNSSHFIVSACLIGLPMVAAIGYIGEDMTIKPPDCHQISRVRRLSHLL